MKIIISILLYSVSMSQVISFSADRDFARDFDALIERSGYRNRSRFIRDASMFFAEIQQRGELRNMDEDMTIEGHLVVYYQHDHGKGQKLLDLRHSDLIEVASYSHSSLKHSHSCLDLLQVKGSEGNIRFVIDDLKNTPHVDKVSFVVAPIREDGCC